MPDEHVRDTEVGGLGAGEDDGFCDLLGLHHAGGPDGVFGSSVAEGELGFDTAGADNAYLYVELAEFGVERLAEADLGEFGGGVYGLSGCALEAGDRGDKENGPAALLDHDGGGVAGEEEAGLHVSVHDGVVLIG